MKYRTEHTQHSKTSQLKWRSFFDLSLKHKSPGLAFSSMFPGCNERANWSNFFLSPPPPLSLIRGRFGQVHKCVENSSGLTLAAKVIKARSLKEKVRERNPSNVIGCYCDTLVSSGLLERSRVNTSAGEKCLTQKRWCFVSQQRTAETFHCVCLSMCPSACLW